MAGILASSPLAIAGETSQVNLSKCQRVSTDIKATDKNGNTVVHFAARDSKVDLIRLLLEKGADINAKDEDGWMALPKIDIILQIY